MKPDICVITDLLHRIYYGKWSDGVSDLGLMDLSYVLRDNLPELLSIQHVRDLMEENRRVRTLKEIKENK